MKLIKDATRKQLHNEGLAKNLYKTRIMAEESAIRYGKENWARIMREEGIDVNNSKTQSNLNVNQDNNNNNANSYIYKVENNFTSISQNSTFVNEIDINKSQKFVTDLSNKTHEVRHARGQKI